MKLFSFTIIFFLIICSRTSASNAVKEVNVYSWKVIRIVDGDTLEIANQFLPKELKLFVRMKGVDTPEKAPRAKCEKENILAQKASNYTKNSIENAQKNRQKITFSEIKWDKYGGRILSNVYLDGELYSKKIIDAGLARPYFGDKKEPWCN